MSSVLTLTKRLSVAALSSIAIAGAVVAPANAAPTTAGCAAKSQPTITLGKANGVRVEVPAAAGWRNDPTPNKTPFAVGQIASADNQDGFNVRIGYPKDPDKIRTSADLANTFASPDEGASKALGRRTIAGPCGLPTVSVRHTFVDSTSKRVAYAVTRYTLLQHGSTTVGVIVQGASYDQQRLADVERTLLDGYGIRLPA
ncbi:hypothetical protein [Tsukamurella ocularis]|uniref:hypothetical protein n=1 Tax=Tsukamurella ocularis TaxID=1970234 RepID=UPI002168246F|nr:hypothetical protein [Tsukamurella ocularis]MCS3781606.1 hypothetical protein [Tsukamurella ocularis]MCS3787978.1 hypothetical protein [Tsukamurella ocularis]MCS3851273.1 hypothetical protein [Tsukamurella ocularis]